MSQEIINKLREDAGEIFMAGLRAVDPIYAVKRVLKLENSTLEINGRMYDLNLYDRILVLGAGKAGASMSRAVEEVMGDIITFGHVNIKYGHFDKVNKIALHEASHPTPDSAGLHGAKIIYDTLRNTNEKDLIIFLLSGGGSALLPLPAGEISLTEKQQATSLLLSCGATIQEINTIRKHISLLKGGQLAEAAYPATIVTLIISDVIGDPLDAIASGPTVPDPTTFKECISVLKKYDILDKIPKSVIEHINKGVNGFIRETPKSDEKVFDKVQNVIIASNMEAFKASKEKTVELGYNTLILSTMIEGETRDVAKVHTAIAKEILKSGNPVKRPACILSGGETTVTINGNGLGGRNQEFVLASAIEISGLDNVVVFSGATDGTDGPTDSAGAVADGFTVKKAIGLNMDPLEYLMNNDSYHFFINMGDLITTGPTNTNVMDVRIIIVV